MYETHTFTTTGGAALTIEPSDFKGQRFSDGNRNVQVSARNLAGGTYTLFYRPAGSSQFVSHVGGASELDQVMLAGVEAPIFDALKVEFAGVGAAPAVQTIQLNTWPRGL